MPQGITKKKFGALARKSKLEPFVTCVIYAESLDDAIKWFGENSYEVDGKVYPRGK